MKYPYILLNNQRPHKSCQVFSSGIFHDEEGTILSYRFLFVESVNDETQMKKLTESINLDFPESLIEDKRENSIEDKIFMDQVSSSLTKSSLGSMWRAARSSS
jgi:hypothetical protein